MIVPAVPWVTESSQLGGGAVGLLSMAWQSRCDSSRGSSPPCSGCRRRSPWPRRVGLDLHHLLGERRQAVAPFLISIGSRYWKTFKPSPHGRIIPALPGIRAGIPVPGAELCFRTVTALSFSEPHQRPLTHLLWRRRTAPELAIMRCSCAPVRRVEPAQPDVLLQESSDAGTGKARQGRTGRPSTRLSAP